MGLLSLIGRDFSGKRIRGFRVVAGPRQLCYGMGGLCIWPRYPHGEVWVSGWVLIDRIPPAEYPLTRLPGVYPTARYQRCSAIAPVASQQMYRKRAAAAARRRRLRSASHAGREVDLKTHMHVILAWVGGYARNTPPMKDISAHAQSLA